uniref:Transcription factor CP2 n=1 Tax=Sphaerodactylus townsendi TaxID=933632 RepID=A0ACB8EN29_9SAUR
MVRPRLTIYVCQEPQQLRDQQKHEDGDAGSSTFFVYHAIYLEELTAVELTEKIAQLFSISSQQISQIYKQGPTGIHVIISDEMIQNFPDESCFVLDTMKGDTKTLMCVSQQYASSGNMDKVMQEATEGDVILSANSTKFAIPKGS